MKKYYVTMYNSIGCNIGEFETKAKSRAEALNKIIKENHILIEKGDTFEFEIDDFIFTF